MGRLNRPKHFTMNAIEVKHLSKSYADFEVLKDISFTIGVGESIAIIGSNGAGKSTLLKCLTRITEPSQGSINIFGDPILKFRTGALRRMRSSIGVVFQKHNLVPRLSVLTNVIHGDIGRLHNVSKFPLAGIRNWGQISASNRTRKKAMEALEMVSLSHLALQRADTLSGGQSQRVAIARALMQEPNMILADEPVASLDPVAANEVMSLFYDLCKNKNITLIFTSHNVEHALEYGNKVLAIKNGRLSLFKDSNSIEIKTLQAEYD